MISPYSYDGARPVALIFDCVAVKELKVSYQNKGVYRV